MSGHATSDDLRRRASAAARWTALAIVATTILQIVQMATLTQLISPAAFGLVAMVNVIAGFVAASTDLGFGAAIIHRSDATENQLSTLYWLNLFAGFVSAALIMACTPLAVLIFDEPRVAEILPYMALLVVISPIGQPFRLLLQRRLAFSPIAVIEIASTAIGVVVAISAARAGAGVFALVWATLASATIRSTAFAAIGGRSSHPRFVFCWSETRGLLSFGLYQLGQRIVTYFNNRVEHFVIGASLGPDALGLYSVACSVTVTPAMRLGDMLRRVAFPVFSQTQDDLPRLRRGYVELLSNSGALFLPALLGLGAVSTCLMPTLFGLHFAASAPIARYLAVVAALRLAASIMGSVLLARGRADWGFRWNLAITALHVPAVLLGALEGGLVGVAVALMVAQIVYTTVNQLLLVRNLIGSTTRELARRGGPILLSAVAMAAVVSLVDVAMADRRGPLLLAAEVVVGVLVYTALLGTFQRSRFGELLDLAGLGPALPRAASPPKG